MGHISHTSNGHWRANWRDPAGRQRAKTFPTKRQATRFLAEVETSKSQGQYIDPHAGRVTMAEFVRRWESARVVESTTSATTRSRLNAQILPYWGSWQVGKIDHLAVQEWVNRLSRVLAPSTVASCHGTFSAVMASAVRARLIAVNPCEGVKLPAVRKIHHDDRTIDRATLLHKLLPAIPGPYRALPAMAAGAGLRWGECLGLRWSDIDLDGGVLHVHRVLIEVRGHASVKDYGKSAAARRHIPIPRFLADALTEHRARIGTGPKDAVFLGPDGGYLLRGNFRSRIWRPSLVRAGLLGQVVQIDRASFRAEWPTRDGRERVQTFGSERAAVKHVAKHAYGGLRFHDLRHCYATWLVSSGAPVNVVQRVMGHEQASTTLGIYTHAPRDFDKRIRAAFDDPADFSPTANTDETPEGGDQEE